MNIDIDKLKALISDYETEKSYLSDMADQWEKYDDPGSDPGIQFSQAEVVEKSYNNLKDYIYSLANEGNLD
jgi:hypothetical protein